MKVAELRHVIYIQNPTTTQTARGAESIAWSTSAALRASVRTVSGDERNRSELVVPVAGHQVTLRWPLPSGTALTTKSRIKWTQDGVTRYFGVTAIGEPDNHRRKIVLTCEELVGEDRVL